MWKNVFALVVIKIKIFHSCCIPVVFVALGWHSCRLCSTCVALVLDSCCSCLTRLALVLLLSRSCRSCCTRVTLVWHSCCKPHKCNTSETQMTWVRHDYDTSATRMTRVQHECYTWTTWVWHKWKILILITIQVKTFFHIPILAI